MPDPDIKPCPDCKQPMDCADTGYCYLWDCTREACGYADGHFQIYDMDRFLQVKAVQSAVGQQAAERLAGEFKNGALA